MARKPRFRQVVHPRPHRILGPAGPVQEDHDGEPLGHFRNGLDDQRRHPLDRAIGLLLGGEAHESGGGRVPPFSSVSKRPSLGSSGTLGRSSSARNDAFTSAGGLRPVERLRLGLGGSRSAQVRSRATEMGITPSREPRSLSFTWGEECRRSSRHHNPAESGGRWSSLGVSARGIEEILGIRWISDLQTHESSSSLTTHVSALQSIFGNVQHHESRVLRTTIHRSSCGNASGIRARRAGFRSAGAGRMRSLRDPALPAGAARVSLRP